MSIEVANQVTSLGSEHERIVYPLNATDKMIWRRTGLSSDIRVYHLLPQINVKPTFSNHLRTVHGILGMITCRSVIYLPSCSPDTTMNRFIRLKISTKGNRLGKTLMISACVFRSNTLDQQQSYFSSLVVQ